MEEKNESKEPGRGSSRDLTSWFAGRRDNVERWVDETCRGAIARARGVVAEEIRGLSRRVERVHELLDQVEQMVDAEDKKTPDLAGDGGMSDGES